MRTLFVMTVGLCLTCINAVAEFNPFEGPKPLVIFIQSDPWAMVIGSDTPRVAVYENGDVIFTKRVKNRLVYHYVTLDKKGLDKLRVQIQPVLALKDLKPSYDVQPNLSDQPEAMFYFRDGDREITTSVYGLVDTDTKLPANTKFPNDPKAMLPPKELLEFHRWLCSLEYPNSKEWIPRYVEVMLWDYSYAPKASIQWPKGWPSLKSSRAIKRSELHSIFLDGALMPNLCEFLATQKDKGAIEIDGKKWAAAVRYTFPSELLWRKAFERPLALDRKITDRPFLRPYVEQLKKSTSPDDLNRIKSMAKSDLILLHHGYGTGIRNRWLRGNRDPQLLRFFRDNGIDDIDHMSGVIIDALWNNLNSNLDPAERASLEAKRALVVAKRASYEKLESECEAQLVKARDEFDRNYKTYGLPSKNPGGREPFYELVVEKTGRVRDIVFFDGASFELKEHLRKTIQQFKFSAFANDEQVTIYIVDFPRCLAKERDKLY